MIDGGSMGLDAAAPAAWRLRLNGAPQLLAPDGTALPLDRHGALIAARLALAGPQPRELLARQLWPDADEARARGNVRQRLLRLDHRLARRTLGTLQPADAVAVRSKLVMLLGGVA